MHTWDRESLRSEQQKPIRALDAAGKTQRAAVLGKAGRGCGVCLTRPPCRLGILLQIEAVVGIKSPALLTAFRAAGYAPDAAPHL